jgi:hypothetical protein
MRHKVRSADMSMPADLPKAVGIRGPSLVCPGACVCPSLPPRSRETMMQVADSSLTAQSETCQHVPVPRRPNGRRGLCPKPHTASAGSAMPRG